MAARADIMSWIQICTPDMAQDNSNDKLDILIDQVGRFTEGITVFQLAMTQASEAFRADLADFRESNTKASEEFRAELAEMKASLLQQTQLIQSQTQLIQGQNERLDRLEETTKRQAATAEQQAETSIRLVGIVEALLQERKAS